ncbi:MAG: glycosyltransferase family 2 protein [Candidatus Firestonebacteria bacterium]|nr:glycosyltransferase family 2 protein [Candidatus Firestonebacteria bacterium]
MPLFSIVIPTCNHPDLLKSAIQSAVDQDFDDFEIIVSDNSSNHSAEPIVKQFNNKKIVYACTNNLLQVDKSWEFALLQAKGEYVCFIADDDACIPFYLSKLATVINQYKPDLIQFELATYYGGTMNLPNVAYNSALIRPFTRKIFEAETKKEIKKRYMLDFGGLNPLIINACFSRKIIEQIIKKNGYFFNGPGFEFSATTMFLSLTDKFYYLDEILAVSGFLSNKNERSMYNNRDVKFKTELEWMWKNVPLNGIYNINWRAEALLRSKKVFFDNLNEFDLSWENYFIYYYNEIIEFENRGFDVNLDLSEFWTVLQKQPDSIKTKVQSVIFKQKIKKIIYNIGRNIVNINKKFKKFVIPKKKWPMIVMGEDIGFNNLIECAQKLQTLLPTIQSDNEVFTLLKNRQK